MQLARSRLLGPLVLLGALSLGFTSEIVPVTRNADPVPVSPGEEARDRNEPSATSSSDLALGLEVQPDAGSDGLAQLAGDCWIVSQWSQSFGGVLHLCTKWQCVDGRTWTECVPI